VSSKTEWFGGLLIVGLSIGLGALMFAPDPKPPIVNNTIDTVTVTVIDYIDREPVIIQKIVTLRDTIFVESGDTVTTEVAQLDTVFSDSASISVDYFVTPRVFKVNYTPAPIQVKEIRITNTEYIDTHKKWDRFRIGAYSGVLGTALLFFLVK
jgi:hypothetical protein